MEMDRHEIVQSFMEAKNRKEQISILADLNDCSVPEIIAELKAGGVNYKLLPRKKREAAGASPRPTKEGTPEEAKCEAKAEKKLTGFKAIRIVTPEEAKAAAGASPHPTENDPSVGRADTSPFMGGFAKEEPKEEAKAGMSKEPVLSYIAELTEARKTIANERDKLDRIIRDMDIRIETAAHVMRLLW